MDTFNVLMVLNFFDVLFGFRCCDFRSSDLSPCFSQIRRALWVFLSSYLSLLYCVHLWFVIWICFILKRLRVIFFLTDFLNCQGFEIPSCFFDVSFVDKVQPFSTWSCIIHLFQSVFSAIKRNKEIFVCSFHRFINNKIDLFWRKKAPITKSDNFWVLIYLIIK